MPRKLNIISFLFLICLTASCVAEDKIRSAATLKNGDLIFWKDSQQADRAGHVAVISNESNQAQNLKIIHATNNPKYEAFVETAMLASKKLQQSNKYYFVISIKDQEIRSKFINILRSWLDNNITFNTNTESLMKMWDDSMAAYSTAVKFKLQNELFAEKPMLSNNIHKDGYMCSEAIIIALQKAFMPNNFDINKLPASLKLDPILCPPSTFMFALEHDQNNFVVLGKFINE